MSRACPLCQSQDVRELFVKESVPYCACRACKLRFALPAINPNFHALNEFEPAYIQYLEDHIADRKNYTSLLQWMGRFADLKAGKVLDIGCGTGKWVRFLRRAGLDAAGIEPAKALYDQYLATEPCYRNTSAETLVANGEGGYPVITSLDVLEHVQQPGPFLQSLAKLVAPGGKVFMSTPDVGSLPAKVCGRYWHFYERYHLSYFTRKTFTRLAEQSGFRVINWGHRGKYFPVGYILRYAFLFLFGKAVTWNLPRLDRLHIPLNTMDIMYACLQREE